MHASCSQQRVPEQLLCLGGSTNDATPVEFLDISQPTCMVSLASLLLPSTPVSRLLSFAAFSEAAWHSWGTAWKPLEANWGTASGVMLGSIIRLDSSPQHPCTTRGGVGCFWIQVQCLSPQAHRPLVN